MNKIVLAGGTGFVGRYLSAKFREAGFNVFIISRRANHINWNDRPAIISALEDATLLINLAGKSVDCRYTEKNKREIFDSRINTTIILGNAIESCKTPPVTWINSGTATIYRHAEDRAMTENDGDIGKGFSVEVATSWEKAFFNFELEHTRQIVLRMAIVLGKGGGVINPFRNLVKYGLGGPQGTGRQMFSWIHIEDLYQVILFLGKDQHLSGIFNVSSPNPVSNTIFMESFRKIMGKSFGLPSPAWRLKIGAVLINTETELILKSRWVIPARLQNEGYNFRYVTIDSALENILKPVTA